MIKSRSSEDHLSKEQILSRVRDVDIFAYYCSSFKELGKKFSSELRDDPKPSASIIIWKGRARYKDFGHPDHSFDCFDYVQFVNNCSFFDALRIIDHDFSLNLSTHPLNRDFSAGKRGDIAYVKYRLKTVTIIKVKRRRWEEKDKLFWKQFLISSATLEKYDIFPIEYYWINEHRFKCELTYAYKMKGKYKLYSPYDPPETKWVSNTTPKQVQGYTRLPESGKLCLLQSSLKDIACLDEIVPSCAMGTEMMMPPRALVEHLQTRFDEVAVLYDNDFYKRNLRGEFENNGQMMAERICREYSLRNIVIPYPYLATDPSEYVQYHQEKETLRYLIYNL